MTVRQRLRLSLGSLCAVIPLLAGCDDTGVLVSPVSVEPLQVQGGQFFSGPLPTGTGPAVDFINTQASVFPAGAINKTLTGDADMGATAVLLRFADLGSGYWSVPVGMPDIAMSNGALSWLATCNFSEDIPAGRHPLVFNAIDASGNAGPAPGANQTETLTFLPLVPKGDVVISLTWDTGADLDLHLVAPDGTELDPQHPNTAAMREPDGGLPPARRCSIATPTRTAWRAAAPRRTRCSPMRPRRATTQSAWTCSPRAACLRRISWSPCASTAR